jgi:hypothetical protein
MLYTLQKLFRGHNALWGRGEIWRDILRRNAPGGTDRRLVIPRRAYPLSLGRGNDSRQVTAEADLPKMIEI